MTRYSILFLLGLMVPGKGFSQNEKHAAVFLPGVVSVDGHDFNACFSKDGKSFYFSRTQGDNMTLYISRQQTVGWSVPERLPFCNDGFSYADPTFGPDGDLYFISNRPTHKGDTTTDFDIWKISPAANAWGNLVNVAALNTDAQEYYISFTARGDVYFASTRKGGYGEEDIYGAKRVNGKFEVPANLGPAVNSPRSEYDPFVSANGRILIFASSGRPDAFGKADLYWSAYGTAWSDVQHLPAAVNSPTRDYCPYIFGDRFFFSSDGEVKVIPVVDLPEALTRGLSK